MIANVTLINKVQVPQNMAANIVLDRTKHSSATEELDQAWLGEHDGKEKVLMTDFAF